MSASPSPTEVATEMEDCHGCTLSQESIQKLIIFHLKYTQVRSPHDATKRDWWMAVSHAIQDLTNSRMLATKNTHYEHNVRRVYYMSLEFLMGRLLTNNLLNNGVYGLFDEALKNLGQDLEVLIDQEYDMALGNGGLGRLAACFLDSMATLDLPSLGYGIRYEFGLFRQQFVQGKQVEHPDNWLIYGDVWEICRPEYTQNVELYGHVDNVFDDLGRYRPKWRPTTIIKGVPYDVPICGYGTNTVNYLRLWESRADEEIDLDLFNQGGYVDAVRQKNMSETVSKVLYPNDSTESGKELRLVQQYFFVSCSLKDIIRRYKISNKGWDAFPEKVVIQLNDTHPSIAVVELLRILHDEEDIAWEQAWDLITRTFAYTNHTLLPEALEKWSVGLFNKVLPRHTALLYEINRRHMLEVDKVWPGDESKKRELSLIEDSQNPKFRMAHLAVIASFSVNGVAAIHTELLKANLFPSFNQMFPGRFNNKTNGITPRRWLHGANPKLAVLISETIGDGWIRDLDQLQQIRERADQAAFQKNFMKIKHENKVELARIIRQDCGVTVDPNALFDVQIKRLHEYKRQHLNLLHILHLYRQLVQNPDLDICPRVFIFGAKAAPGYELAKTIIHAINAVGEKINHDKRIQGKLKVVFLPNYRVSLAAKIIPAADLSEQISTAGKEASGTGNMKLALNGALTIGTMDGANIEICEEVGEENIFIFGKTVDEVEALRQQGYDPRAIYESDEELRALVDWLGSSYFTPDEPHALMNLKHSLVDWGDPYMVLADFRAYCDAQARVDEAYKDSKRWAKMAIINTASMGKFSSDRTIREYAEQIWRLDPVRVSL